MCVPRSVPLSIDQLSTFLNTPAPSHEGACGDLKSLWSSVRPSLQHTHATILLSRNLPQSTVIVLKAAGRKDMTSIECFDANPVLLTSLHQLLIAWTVFIESFSVWFSIHLLCIHFVVMPVFAIGHDCLC